MVLPDTTLDPTHKHYRESTCDPNRYPTPKSTSDPTHDLTRDLTPGHTNDSTNNATGTTGTMDMQSHGYNRNNGHNGHGYSYHFKPDRHELSNTKYITFFSHMSFQITPI